MQTVVTGSFGRVGTALISHLSQDHNFTYLDRSDHENYDVVVADIADFDSVQETFQDHDAVVHLAGCPTVNAPWSTILENNIIGTYNILEAARQAEVESVVFASTSHVMGLYEDEHAPEIYEPEFNLILDHHSPRRPDSYYAVSKSFGEDLGRYYVENYEYPNRFYGLRICSVRHEEFDHPFADAEKGVHEGSWERGSDEYELQIKRMKAMWQSRRDCAHLIECCLGDNSVVHDVFYGVSNNQARWFDIQHASDIVGYEPIDSADEFDNPPGE